MEEVSFLSEGSERPESTENIEELSNVSSKSAPTNDGQGLQMLRSRLKLLEHSLEDQRITSDYLREERDKAVDVNRALRRELEELRREVYIENSTIFSAERAPGRAQNYQTGPLKVEESLTGYLIGFPRKCAHGLLSRVALFVWWTGVWMNEGLGMLRIENKWVELERTKCELEQENARLHRQIFGLQKLLAEREYELVGQMERNKELTKRMNKKCGSVPCSCGRNHSYEAMAKHVHTVADFSECLSQVVEKMKQKMDQQFSQFEKVSHDIEQLTESQRLIEEKVNAKSASTAHDLKCHKTTAESSKELETEKAILPRREIQENTANALNQGKETGAEIVANKISRACGLIFYSCRIILIFLFTFLALGFLFHFLLVSSSLRLPSSPVKDYYGVDLFALWCYFVNCMFSLLVTE